MSSPSSPRSNLGVISSNIEISPPQRSTLASAARRIPSYLGDITIMVDSNNSTRFPGWYTDPRSPDMERFWDGRTWTDSTRDAETASAARADVVVDLTTVPGIVSTKPADDVAPPAPTTAFFEADNGAGLFSQPAGAPERASAAGQGDAKAAASPSALTGLFGKPDPSAAAAPKVEQPTARSSATAPSATAPAPTAPSESASRETVKKPDLSPTSDVTKEQLESAKAQLEKEPVAAEPAPSMVDLLKPKEGAEPSAPGTTRKAKPAQGANASSGSQLSEVTKAQARKTATSFPNSIAQPRPAEPKSSGTAAKTTGPASTPRTAKPKTSASQRVGSPTKAPTSTSIDHDPKTPWTAWAVIAGLCLAGGGFLLGLWAGSGDSEGSAGVEVTTTAASPRLSAAWPMAT